MTEEKGEEVVQPLNQSSEVDGKPADQNTEQLQEAKETAEQMERAGAAADDSAEQEEVKQGDVEKPDDSKPDDNPPQQQETAEGSLETSDNSGHPVAPALDEKPSEPEEDSGKAVEGQDQAQEAAGVDNPTESRETEEKPAELSINDNEEPVDGIEKQAEPSTSDSEKPVESVDSEKPVKDEEEGQGEVKESEGKKLSQSKAEEQQGDEAKPDGETVEEPQAEQQQESTGTEENKPAAESEKEQPLLSQEDEDIPAESQGEADATAEQEPQEPQESQSEAEKPVESQEASEQPDEAKPDNEPEGENTEESQTAVDHEKVDETLTEAEKPEESQTEVENAVKSEEGTEAQSENTVQSQEGTGVQPDVTTVGQGVLQAGSVADDQVTVKQPDEMRDENKKLKQDIFVAKQQADAFRIRVLSLEQEVGKLRARKIDNRSQDSLASDSDSYLKQKLGETERELDAAERKVKDLQLRLKRFAKDDQIKDEKISQMEKEIKELSDKNKNLEQSLVESKTESNNNATATQQGPDKNDSKVCIIL